MSRKQDNSKPKRLTETRKQVRITVGNRDYIFHTGRYNRRRITARIEDILNYFAIWEAITREVRKEAGITKLELSILLLIDARARIKGNLVLVREILAAYDNTLDQRNLTNHLTHLRSTGLIKGSNSADMLGFEVTQKGIELIRLYGNKATGKGMELGILGNQVEYIGKTDSIY